MRQKMAIVVIGVILGLGLWGSPASATMRLRIEDVTGGIGAVITDNGVGDLNPLLGALMFSGSVGFSTVNVTTGLSKPLIGGGSIDLGQLDLNSVNFTMSGPGTLRLTLEDDGYTAGPL